MDNVKIDPALLESLNPDSTAFDPSKVLITTGELGSILPNSSFSVADALEIARTLYRAMKAKTEGLPIEANDARSPTGTVLLNGDELFFLRPQDNRLWFKAFRMTDTEELTATVGVPFARAIAAKAVPHE